ncbi:hypothetical protein [Leptospira levettii]|uniref:hypothetical protein n=1 Tax=Leptospira levettii TaxID=2023178 RepID=UPI003EB84E79
MKFTKMYEQYLKFVSHAKSSGVIRKAYFTTFILDINFFEKFLIHPLLNQNLEIPKNILDYETINNFLINPAENSNGIALDLKVFSDKRGIDYTQTKKTIIDVAEVNVNFLSHEFRKGVFHPKIIVLETSKSIFLWVSSANLTTSGWGKNIESFVYKEVQSERNIHSINTFFTKILNGSPNFTSNTNKSEDWTFQHNLNGDSVLSYLKSNDKKLCVVSPYFSPNLIKLTEEIKTNFRFEETIIIPDIIGNKVRIEIADLNLLKTKFSLYKFKENNFSNRFVHSKLLITDQNIAIGSWNFTNQALAISPKDTKNVEAGIIFNSTSGKDSIEKNIQMMEDFISSHENDNSDDISSIINIDLPPFSLSLRRNWKDRVFKITKDPESPKVSIRFPFNRSIPFLLDNNDEIPFDKIISKDINSKEIEKTKTFLFNFEGIPNEFIGFILEEEVSYRRGLEFNSLLELLEFNFTSDSIENSSSIRPKNFFDDDLEAIETNNNETTNQTEYLIPYTKIFYYFEKQKIFLQGKSKQELENYIFKLPGNILELKEKIYSLIESEKPSLTYKYIFLKEFQDFCFYLNRSLEIALPENLTRKISEIIENYEDKLFNPNISDSKIYKSILTEIYSYE